MNEEQKIINKRFLGTFYGKPINAESDKNFLLDCIEFMSTEIDRYHKQSCSECIINHNLYNHGKPKPTA